MIALLLSLAIVCGSHRVIDVHVDLIELNSVFDSRGQRLFEQVICWSLNPATGRMQVRTWRIADGEYPMRVNDIVRYEYRTDGIDYRVRSRLYRESWTHNDPEREDSKTHPIRIGFPIARTSDE